MGNEEDDKQGGGNCAFATADSATADCIEAALAAPHLSSVPSVPRPAA